MFLTTGLFNKMAQQIPDMFSSLDTLLVGGEALDPQWIRNVLQHSPPNFFYNVYGNTENTTFSTLHRIVDVSDHAVRIPIGTAIANSTAYVLDAQLNRLGVGVEGELCVGGDGVALGYLNNPEATNKAFIPDPFSGDSKHRLYRTGDRACYLPDGAIDFLGRLDHQVKVRGFRIELDEIKTILCTHPEVADAVVLKDADYDRLTAFVISNGSKDLDTRALKHHVSSQLPEYCVPNVVVVVDSFPLTQNGKLDHRLLLAKATKTATEPIQSSSGDLESQLLRIWQEVLNVESCTSHDDFFERGGHSLLVLNLVGLIEERLGVSVKINDIFICPTVKGIAALINSTHKAPSPSRPSSFIFPLNGEREGPPVFMIHGGGGHVMYFKPFAESPAITRPLYGIQSPSLDGDGQICNSSVESIAAFYIEEMKTFQPHGPYTIGGACFGGFVAYEMGQQLLKANELVDQVLVFDSYLYPFHQQVPTLWRSLTHGLRNYTHFGYGLTAIKRRLRYSRNRVSLAFTIKGRQVLSLQNEFSKARHCYRLANYPGTLSVFLSKERVIKNHQAKRWQSYVDGTCNICVLPNSQHGEVLEEQYWETVSNYLKVDGIVPQSKS